MAFEATAQGAAEAAIAAIGRGYDVATDIRLKYCKGKLTDPDTHLIDLSCDEVRNIVLPGGLTVAGVPKAIKCEPGERIRLQSDLLSFGQMSEKFNHELSLSGEVPSGMFNSMFEFSGCWQRDAANTESLAFDGWSISLYTVALSESCIRLRDHVIKAVPTTWDPAALARFIEKFGTHVVVAVKMGGKDVIYLKQQHSSSLQPFVVKQRMKEMSDRRFLDAYGKDKEDVSGQQLSFPESSPSSSYCSKEDLVFVVKRRGGKESDKEMPHSKWMKTVQAEPDVISMSFRPITSLLVHATDSGIGFLNHAINLYLRYKPPIEELHQFLEFQLPRQWAPLSSDLPLGPQRQSSASLHLNFMGPKLRVCTNLVDVGKRPVTGLRLYLEGRKGNMLAIHLQHLCSLPQIIQLVDEDPYNHKTTEAYELKYIEAVGSWKGLSYVYTAPVESDDDSLIVTGAQLHVASHGFRKILSLHLRFSKVCNATLLKNPEWEGSPDLGQKSELISVSSTGAKKRAPHHDDVNINSAVYPGGPPVPVQAPKLFRFVDTAEIGRGPHHTPGYWVVSGAKLHQERGKISLRVKYSLLTANEYPRVEHN